MIKYDHNCLDYKLEELKDLLESIEKRIKDRSQFVEQNDSIANDRNCFSNIISYKIVSNVTQINNYIENELSINDNNSSINLINGIECNIEHKPEIKRTDEYIVIKSNKIENSIGNQHKEFSQNTPQFKK